MKKISAILLCALFSAVSLMAQTSKKGNAKDVDLSIRAHSNEVFTVYLNGEQKSEAAVSSFDMQGLKPMQVYDLEVYLEKPIKFISGADLQLSAGHYDLVVYSDPTLEFAEIQFENSINTLTYQSQGGGGNSGGSGVSGESDVSAILVMFSQEPFDDTRLHYAKTVMKDKPPFLTAHIQRIAAAFAYDKARVKFLKFAYNHCADKENYASLADVLSEKEAKDAFAEFMQGK